MTHSGLKTEATLAQINNSRVEPDSALTQTSNFDYVGADDDKMYAWDNYWTY